MPESLTRKELKTDHFVTEVEHGVHYLSVHRQRAVQIAIAVLVVLVIGSGIYAYRNRQNSLREEKLMLAMQAMEAPVNANSQSGALAFPTEDAKKTAVNKALADVIASYPGARQALIAEYYLGTDAAGKGDLANARKHLELVQREGDANLGSLAKLAVAQLDFAQNRAADGEKLMRELIANPTDVVSKEQSTIALARALKSSKPAEARNLIKPLLTVAGPISQAAVALSSELGQ